MTQSDLQKAPEHIAEHVDAPNGACICVCSDCYTEVPGIGSWCSCPDCNQDACPSTHRSAPAQEETQ